jgi:hypothetical protein
LFVYIYKPEVESTKVLSPQLSPVQKQVAAGVSLFVCLHFIAKPEVKVTKVLGPTTPATLKKQVVAGVSLFVCLHFRSKPEVKVTKVLGPTTLATVKKQVVAGGESFLFYISLLIHIKVLGPQLSPLYRNNWQ